MTIIVDWITTIRENLIKLGATVTNIQDCNIKLYVVIINDNQRSVKECLIESRKYIFTKVSQEFHDQLSMVFKGLVNSYKSLTKTIIDKITEQVFKGVNDQFMGKFFREDWLTKPLMNDALETLEESYNKLGMWFQENR